MVKMQFEKPARIFLVEDHAYVRQEISAIINRAGDVVVCGEAEDGETAFSRIVQMVPDLILLDLTLKNSNGIDLLKKLRAVHQQLFVLVLSLHDSPATIQRAFDAGANGFISKQNAIKHLLNAVRTVLSGKTYGRNGPSLDAPPSKPETNRHHRENSENTRRHPTLKTAVRPDSRINQTIFQRATFQSAPNVRQIPVEWPRPKVLHVITHLALGGAERVALDLIHGMRETHRAAVCAIHGVSDDEIGRQMSAELAENSIPVFTASRLRLKFGGMLPAGIRLANVIKQFKPDLIHLHTEIPEASMAMAAALFPHLKTIPTVRTIHNSLYWHCWPKLGRWCDRQLENAMIAAVSEGAIAAFKSLRSASGAVAPPATPTLIYNGVRSTSAVRPLGKLPAKPMRLLFAGRFEFQKGADLLEKIVHQVHVPAGQTFDLSLFGSGKEEAALRRLAAQPPSGWTVRVAPPVSDLARKLAHYDVLLMPSRFEGLSLLAAEAMQQAVPLVTTDGPGLSEQLPPDYPWRARAGDAEDFARVLQNMLNQTESWGTVVAATQDYVQEHFSAAAMLRKYVSLYKSAVETGWQIKCTSTKGMTAAKYQAASA